jgi:hypothetical protein
VTITARHRHMLEVADRTRDLDVIAGIVDTVHAEDASYFEIEQAFRDAGAQSYLIAGDPVSIVLGIKEMLDELNEQGGTPDENRARLKE